MIASKAAGLFAVVSCEERGTSSACPRCVQRARPSGRTFRCPNCGWSGHRDLVGAGNQLGRHDPHADVARLIEQAHPMYLRPWQQGRSNVAETDRPHSPTLSPLEETSASLGVRKWLARDYGGRAAPGNRSREAAAQLLAARGKLLEQGTIDQAPPGTPQL